MSAETLQIPLRHRVVRDWLQRRVGRAWSAGDRLPTIAQLSRELGVGYANVQRALRDLADAGLVVSRRGAGTYVADPLPSVRPENGEAPPNHASARGKVVRLCMAREHLDAFLLRITESLTARLQEPGCVIERAIYDPREMDFRGACPDADALVVLNPDPAPDIYFDERQLVVVINTALESPVAMPGRFDVVSVEQEQGGLLAGRCLRAAGVASACFLGVKLAGSRRYDGTSTARLRGFRRGWGEPPAPNHQFATSGYAVEHGIKMARQYVALDRRPQGVFAASDELAVGFVYGALAHGLHPARDYQIIGFDGQQRGQELGTGPLTTVAVPVEEMGRRGADLLIDRFANPDQPVRRLLLGCSLFEGATVRNASQDSPPEE